MSHDQPVAAAVSCHHFVCVCYHCVSSRGGSRSPHCGLLFSLCLPEQQKVLEVRRLLQKEMTRFVSLNQDKDRQTDRQLGKQSDRQAESCFVFFVFL